MMSNQPFLFYEKYLPDHVGVILLYLLFCDTQGFQSLFEIAMQKVQSSSPKRQCNLGTKFIFLSKICSHISVGKGLNLIPSTRIEFGDSKLVQTLFIPLLQHYKLNILLAEQTNLEGIFCLIQSFVLFVPSMFTFSSFITRIVLDW